VEKEATSSQIIGVIERSAAPKQLASESVAVVDRFQLELGDLTIQMERRMEPETFDRKIKTKTTTTTTTTTTTGKCRMHRITSSTYPTFYVLCYVYSSSLMYMISTVCVKISVST